MRCVLIKPSAHLKQNAGLRRPETPHDSQELSPVRSTWAENRQSRCASPVAGQTKVSHFFATLSTRHTPSRGSVEPLGGGVASSAAAALLELAAAAAGAGLVGAHGRSLGPRGRDERTERQAGLPVRGQPLHHRAGVPEETLVRGAQIGQAYSPSAVVAKRSLGQPPWHQASTSHSR